MRRVISLLLILLLLLQFSFVCEASNTYLIDELGMYITAPDYTVVFTRNTSLDSPSFETYNIDPNTFLSYLNQNNIYLDAIKKDGSYEFVVIGRDNKDYEKIFDLSLYSDNELLKEFSDFETMAEKLGLVIDSTDIYRAGDMKYFTYSARDNTSDQVVYVTSYITIYNGHFIQITLRSYNGHKFENTAQTIVNSVRFKEKLEPSRTHSQSDSIAYKALIAGIVALIAGVPALLLEVRKKKRRNSQTVFSNNNTSVVDEVKNFNSIISSCPPPKTDTGIKPINTLNISAKNSRITFPCGEEDAKYAIRTYVIGSVLGDEVLSKHFSAFATLNSKTFDWMISIIDDSFEQIVSGKCRNYVQQGALNPFNEPLTSENRVFLDMFEILLYGDYDSDNNRAKEWPYEDLASLNLKLRSLQNLFFDKSWRMRDEMREVAKNYPKFSFELRTHGPLR